MFVPVKIILLGDTPMPKYETPASSGCDLRARIDKPIILKPLSRVTVPTGIKIELPEGFEAQVRPRSGLNAKKGIVVFIGTVDEDYRGEIGVTVYNLSDEEFTINPMDRIAQMVIGPYFQADFELTDELSDSVRGEGGFGHSGVK